MHNKQYPFKSLEYLITKHIYLTLAVANFLLQILLTCVLSERREKGSLFPISLKYKYSSKDETVLSSYNVVMYDNTRNNLQRMSV